MSESVLGYLTGGGTIRLELENLPQVFTYDVDGNIETITVVSSGYTFRQTFTWAAGNLTNISQWVQV